MERQLLAADAPAHEREHRFAPPRRWRFDFAWPALGVAIEVDGGVWTQGRHVRPSGFESDVEKLNAAAAAGWRVFRVTSKMLADGSARELAATVLSSDQASSPH